MIPVRSRERGQPPDLSSMLIAEVDRIDRGLTVVATSLPLAQDLVVELLAEDAGGRIVLVLVEDGPSEPLFERTARALLEYRRTAALLSRLYPNGRFDSLETPRVILAAGRFSERLRDQLLLLGIPDLTLLEGVVAEAGGGFHLVVRELARRNPNRAGSGAPKGNGPRSGRTGRPQGAAPVTERPPPTPAAVPNGKRGQGGQGGKDGKGRSESLVDSLKQRLLRLSPDVIEEQDGDLLAFRVSGHLLAKVCQLEDRLLVTPGGERAAQIQVRDEAGVGKAMDAVFERFFGMSPTRRRIAAADRRAARTARLGDREPYAPSESEAGAAGG